MEKNQDHLVQQLYKELKQEFFKETYKFDNNTHKWKQELDSIVTNNRKKEKTLESKYQLLENLANEENNKFYYNKCNSKSKMIRSDEDKEKLERDLAETKQHYQGFLDYMKNKQYYTQTLKLMERRIQEDIDTLNKQMNGIQKLDLKASKQAKQIKEEVDSVWKQENHFLYKQNQEIIQQNKKGYHFDCIIEEKKQKLKTQNDSVKQLTRQYQNVESEIDRLIQILEQQNQEIVRQDHKLEQKYQEKTESQEFIEMIDDLEHIWKVFKSDNPEKYFFQNQDGEIQLKKLQSADNVNMNNNNNDIMEILETSSENYNYDDQGDEIKDNSIQTDSSHDMVDSNDQSQNNGQGSHNLIQTKRYSKPKRVSSIMVRQNNYNSIQSSRRIQIMSRLTIFYNRHNNNIHGFFDEIIKQFYTMFHQGEALKNKLMNMQEEKKIVESDLKKVEQEVQEYKSKMIDSSDLSYNSNINEDTQDDSQQQDSSNNLQKQQQQENQSVTALLFNDRISEGKTKIIYKMKDSQKSIITTLQTISSQFNRFHKIIMHSINCIKESKNHIQINPGTFYTQEVFEKILNEHKAKLSQFEELLFKEKYEDQIQQMKQSLTRIFPSKEYRESIEFIGQWIQCDVINHYFSDKQQLLQEIQKNQYNINSSKELEYYIMNMMSKFNQNSQQIYEGSVKELLSSYQDFFFTIQRQNQEMRDQANIKDLDLFIYDDLEYQKRKGQTIQQKKARQFEEFTSLTSEDKVASLQTIDFDTQIIKKEIPQKQHAKTFVKIYQQKKSPLQSQQQQQYQQRSGQISDNDIKSVESQALKEQSSYTNNGSSAQMSSQFKAIRPNQPIQQQKQQKKKQNKLVFRNNRKKDSDVQEDSINVKYHNNNENIKEMLLEMKYIETMRMQFSQRSRSAEPQGNIRKNQQNLQQDKLLIQQEDQNSQLQQSFNQNQQQNQQNQQQQDSQMLLQQQNQQQIQQNPQVRIVKAFTKMHHQEQKIQQENLNFFAKSQENFRKTKLESKQKFNKKYFQSPQSRPTTTQATSNSNGNITGKGRAKSPQYLKGQQQQKGKNVQNQNINKYNNQYVDQQFQNYEDFQKYFDISNTSPKGGQQSIFPYIPNSNNNGSNMNSSSNSRRISTKNQTPRFSQRKQSPDTFLNSNQNQMQKSSNFRPRSQSPT